MDFRLTVNKYHAMRKILFSFVLILLLPLASLRAQEFGIQASVMDYMTVTLMASVTLSLLDEDSTLYTRVNKAMVKIRRVTDKYDVQELKGMIQEHVSYTNSEVGKRILDHFEEYLPKFKKIIPEDYEKMMSAIIQMEEKGLSREKAKIEAFNMIKNGR